MKLSAFELKLMLPAGSCPSKPAGTCPIWLVHWPIPANCAAGKIVDVDSRLAFHHGSLQEATSLPKRFTQVVKLVVAAILEQPRCSKRETECAVCARPSQLSVASDNLLAESATLLRCFLFADDIGILWASLQPLRCSGHCSAGVRRPRRHHHRETSLWKNHCWSSRPRQARPRRLRLRLCSAAPAVCISLDPACIPSRLQHNTMCSSVCMLKAGRRCIARFAMSLCCSIAVHVRLAFSASRACFTEKL